MDAQLWRGLALYRTLALAYTVVQYALLARDYAHPVRGWVVIAAMALWTVVATYWYAGPARRTNAALVTDLLVGLAVVVAAGQADTPAVVAERSLPMLWAAAPVIAWAIARGWGAGVLTAFALGVAAFVVRGEASGTVVNNTVLLALTAAVLGWVASLTRDAAAARAEATALRERERLGRVVHDGVLQVLAQVARRGPELGPEGAVLAREAGAQEASLRALLTSAPAAAPAGTCDLAADLAALGSERVDVAVPADAVVVGAHEARELVAAVSAALDNTARHAPAAHAWVLLEDDRETVRITVRDDGPGCEASRFSQAETEGRLGVSRSIVSRLRDLGGTAVLWSAPGQGVEVTLTVPRERA